MFFFYFLVLFFFEGGRQGYGVLFCWCLVGNLSPRVICLPASFPSWTLHFLGAAGGGEGAGDAGNHLHLVAHAALGLCWIRWLSRTALFSRKQGCSVSSHCLLTCETAPHWGKQRICPEGRDSVERKGD